MIAVSVPFRVIHQFSYGFFMTNRLSPLLASLLLPICAHAVHAQDIMGFQSPSKNIACIYFEYDGHKALRCDIGDMAGPIPPKPHDCELAWGHTFEVHARGEAGRSCAGDTQIGQPLRILPYGEVWQRSGITCKSEEAGVTCFNTDRRGFSLSRAKQEVF
jgi:hypothetical protein